MVATSDTGAISERLVDTTSKVELIIHPQFPGIELVSPVYYSELVLILILMGTNLLVL
jgi:uncharacterized membrane protein